MYLAALPEMYKRGYNKRMALAIIAVGGALGPLTPPSVLMIIAGGYTGERVKAFYEKRKVVFLGKEIVFEEDSVDGIIKSKTLAENECNEG